MRLSVAVKLEILAVHRPAAPLEEMPMAYVGPLAAFIAQITAPYLQLPNAYASHRKTREKFSWKLRKSSGDGRAEIQSLNLTRQFY